MLSEKKHQMEQLKLDLGPEEFERMLHSNEFRKWDGQFNAYILDVLFTRRQQAAGSCTFLAWKKIYHGLAYDRQNCARYLVPFLNGMRGLSVSMEPFIRGKI